MLAVVGVTAGSLHTANADGYQQADGSIAGAWYSDPGPGPQNWEGLTPRAAYVKEIVEQRWGCAWTGNELCVWRVEGHLEGDPDDDHPSGRGIDAMVSGLGEFPSEGQVAMGDNIAWVLTENADRLGLDNVIWYNRIWERGYGWRNYNYGRYAEIYNIDELTHEERVSYGHYDHVHVGVSRW